MMAIQRGTFEYVQANKTRVFCQFNYPDIRCQTDSNIALASRTSSAHSSQANNRNWCEPAEPMDAPDTSCDYLVPPQN